MVTPDNLSCFKPKTALQILLSPTERRRPWVLFTTPGLFVTNMLRNAIIIIGLLPVRQLLIRGSTEQSTILGHLLIYQFLVALVTVVQSPLEVVEIRLAIQRNHDIASTHEEAPIVAPLVDHELEGAVW